MWGTTLTLAQLTGHCPGSISREPADAPSPVQTVPRTSTLVTRHTGLSYPQKLSTGRPVSRETRRRTRSPPVDTAVEDLSSIGVVSRETPTRSAFNSLCAQLVDSAAHRSRTWDAHPGCDGCGRRPQGCRLPVSRPRAGGVSRETRMLGSCGVARSRAVRRGLVGSAAGPLMQARPRGRAAS